MHICNLLIIMHACTCTCTQKYKPSMSTLQTTDLQWFVNTPTSWTNVGIWIISSQPGYHCVLVALYCAQLSTSKLMYQSMNVHLFNLSFCLYFMFNTGCFYLLLPNRTKSKGAFSTSNHITKHIHLQNLSNELQCLTI